MEKTLEREQLIREIAAAERELSDLQAQQQRIETHLSTLRERYKSTAEPLTGIPPASPARSSSNLSPNQKVKLYRNLFRGRDDVYPRMWISSKNGRKGYSPACGNEWKPGLCGKSRGVKCTDCSHRSFLAVTDQTILDHLQGRHVVGVYPLLQDDTCWFLAVDFDKEQWRDDVMAFVETCRSKCLQFAVERSRSGNGAHVWFFFDVPVTAVSARKMGCFLLTETMARRHQLSMASYDRLFPNQDTLPRGGFGNLIALPLQHDPRQKGNTVFLYDHLDPIPDQWAFLASLQRIPPGIVETLAAEASSSDQVMGMQTTDTGGESAKSRPWLQTPSRRQVPPMISEPIPSVIRAILSQRLYVEKPGLPSALLNQIKRLAAFQNPEFYKKQNLRLSTALTPRVIACAEDHTEHVSLPRGCLDNLESLLGRYGSRVELEDLRELGTPLDVDFHGELTETQEQAAKAMLSHETGVLVAPPGIGKTVLGTYLIATRRINTVVLVHRQPLLDQWKAQLGVFLGLEPGKIGRIGGGKRKITGSIDVAMIQSLSKKDSVDDLVARYGQVIVDECHHLPAASYERVLSEVKARYVVGLTATPHRRDGHHPIVYMQLGPVRLKVDAKGEAAQRPFEHRLIVRETDFDTPPQAAEISIQKLYGLLAVDEQRNEKIIDDVLLAMEEGRSPILLTERKRHLEFLYERLKYFVRHIVILRGGRSAKEQRAVREQLDSIPDTEERLLLATGKFIGEGYDDARLDTLFLALPVSWKGILVQYTGRLHRLHPGKREVRVVDYVDTRIPMLARMFEKRLRGYKAMGYTNGEL